MGRRRTCNQSGDGDGDALAYQLHVGVVSPRIGITGAVVFTLRRRIVTPANAQLVLYTHTIYNIYIYALVEGGRRLHCVTYVGRHPLQVPPHLRVNRYNV